MLFLPFFTPKALFLAAFQDLQRAHSSNICRLSTGSQGLVVSNQHKVQACFLTFLAPDSETLQERMDDGCSQNNFADLRLSDSAHLTLKHLRLCFVWHWHLLERFSAILPKSFDSSSDCLCSLYRTYYTQMKWQGLDLAQASVAAAHFIGEGTQGHTSPLLGRDGQGHTSPLLGRDGIAKCLQGLQWNWSW